MTQPTNYTPTTDFSQQESINASGRSTVNTAALDAEFANIETTLDQTVSNLSLIQRDDGRLKDVCVEIHTISQEVLNLIGGGYVLRGLWAAATTYAKNDICSNGAYTYACRTAHTAGGSFDGQYWDQFGFTSGADAAQAAAAAQVSANDADRFSDAAAASATAASASSTTATTQAGNAATSASTATTKAGAAATSATNAANSATAAQTAAANLPNATTAGADKFLQSNPTGTGWLYKTVPQALSALGVSAPGGAELVGFIQSGTGSVARTMEAKGRETISVEDKGAVGDGVTDDTAAFVAAFASGAKHIEASGVSYKVGQFAIPATCRRFYSRSGSLLIPAASVPSGATVADWITWSSATKGKMWGFEINAPVATYPNLTVLSLLGCSKMKLQDMQMPEGGRQGVYLGNCVYCKVIDVDVYEFTYKGIAVDGTTAEQSSSNQVLFSNVEGNGSAHCISFVNGSRNSAFGNNTARAVTFGIGFNNAQGGIAALNTNFNTGHEGLNIEDSNRVLLAMNNLEWPVAGSNSADFGISVFGNAAITQFNSVIGNIVALAGASGISLADNVSLNMVQDNIIDTCNRTNIANHAGVLLYGSNCVKNVVKSNGVTDAIGTQHKYGISEHNFGTGAPGLNEITGNRIEGFVTADIKRTDKSTPILLNSGDLDAFRTYIPTVTSATGAITTASALGYYMEFGDIVLAYVRATITTNGTGATSVSISAPFTGVRGSGSGKELGVTGKGLTVEVGANFSVRFYDNSYPGANGAILDIFVIYQRS